MLLHHRVARLAAVVYFVQGSLGIASIAFLLYLRAQGFGIAKITFISSISSIPWFLKIIYGAISDAVPLWGLRRQPYLIFYIALSCMGWMLLGLTPPHERWIIGSMMLANLGFAATDVITDGLVVEHSKGQAAQTYQGIAWGARSIGSIVSGLTGGVLAVRMPAQSVFLITASLPLVSLSATLLLREKQRAFSVHPRNVVSPILDSVRHIFHGDLRWFMLLLFVLSSSVAIGTPLFFYMRETLLFTEVFLGMLNSITWLGAMIGCFLFLKFFRRVRLRIALYWATAIGFVNVLVTLAIRGHVSAFVIALCLGILGYNVLLPIFSSAARLVHGTKVEGSLYAILMSWFNVGQALAGFLGGIAYEWIGLELLIVVTALFGLLAFLVIPHLKSI